MPSNPDDESFGTVQAKSAQPGLTIGDAARVTAAVVLLIGLLVQLGPGVSLFLALITGLGWGVWAWCRTRPKIGLRVFGTIGLGGVLVLAVFKLGVIDDRRIILAILDLLLIYPILLGSGGAWLAAAWPRPIEAHANWLDWLILGLLVLLGSIFAVVLIGWVLLSFLFGGFYN